MNMSPFLLKITPFATSACEPAVFAALRLVGVTVMVPGGSERTSRPTPPTPATKFTSFDIGCTRNTSTPAPPPGGIFHTRPTPVVPSPVQRLPKRSNPTPLVPGTPVPYAVASGGLAAFGVNVNTLSPSETYRLPASSKVIPDGLHWVVALGAGILPTTTRDGLATLMRHTGHETPLPGWRPGV